jgi:hypothetical protein
MNSLTVESLGVAPSSILFGNAIDLDRGIFLPHMTKANAEMKLSKWTADMLGKQAEVIKIALEHQQAIDNKRMSEGPKSQLYLYRISLC